MSWSTQTNELRCIGQDRLFDKIVKQGHAVEEAQLNREKKLAEYLSQPQRGNVRGAAPVNRDGLKLESAGPRNMPASHRSGPPLQAKVASGNNRSVSQLETVETVSAHNLASLTCFASQSIAKTNLNESAIMTGSKHVAEIGQPQFGFTTNAMKMSLFSRMSPNARTAANSFADAGKVPTRSMGSSNNIVASTNLTTQTMASPNAGRTMGNMNTKSGRSPFRDAMQKGVLSGAGMLTH